MLSKIKAFKILRSHRKKAEKRTFNGTQKMVTKILAGIAVGISIIYLMGIAIMFSMIINDSERITSLEFLAIILPFILTIDFLLRFSIQQTPAQIIKPYTLLNISRATCIDSFILTSMLSWGNLIWMALFLPFCIMSVVFQFGLLTTVLVLLFVWLVIMANSQWYIIVRTLINYKVWWWILPIAVYAIVFSPWWIKDFDFFADFYGSIGRLFERNSLLPLIGILILLAVLAWINRRLQLVHIWRELARVEVSTVKGTKFFNTITPWLSKRGSVGQYMLLEAKSMLRNKNPRKAIIFSLVIIIVISLLIAFTPIYDGNFYTKFWGIYNYMLFGAMILTKIMCYEGNYIDCLMVREENILDLLKAKYIIFTVLLLFPFLLMLPTVISGKWSLLMLVSYGLFTAGFQYFMIFQLAVFNNQTVPLNAKLIGKSGMENNSAQVILQLVAFFMPITVLTIFQRFTSETISNIILLVVGLIFILTSNIWLKNIYNRMMKRKYKNLEAMHASR